MAGEKATRVIKRVQTFGKKKTATAVASVTHGAQHEIKINDIPVSQIRPATLRAKIMEPVNLIGARKVFRLKIKVTVRGGGPVSQAYATRQAIAKGIVAY